MSVFCGFSDFTWGGGVEVEVLSVVLKLEELEVCPNEEGDDEALGLLALGCLERSVEVPLACILYLCNISGFVRRGSTGVGLPIVLIEEVALEPDGELVLTGNRLPIILT